MQYNYFFSKYKYIRPLGHGGCGDVFLAENIALGNLWAVKEIVKSSKTSISGYIEPEILKRLNHPALPRICDVHEDETKIYIVEDYIEGVCLKEELNKKGKFEEQIVIDWGIQLCSVLEYLHCQKPNPIIYGDMKPHNIILTKEGFVKLIDFGVSTLVSNENEPSNICDTAFIGTVGYAAPEQFAGCGMSRASDIYSLGITLIQLITGLDPIKQKTMFQNERYGQGLSQYIFGKLRKCVNPNPELRYQTAEILMKELRQCSLHNEIGDLDTIKGYKKPMNFAKLIAITGARGTGVSTITVAMAEYMARGPTSVCIVDLSSATRLEKSLFGGHEVSPSSRYEKDLYHKNEKPDSCTLIKITSNLSYINLNYLADKINSDELLFHKDLAQLQYNFSYLFIDVDITLLKFLEQYLNHTFIVSDMNPFNLLDLGQQLQEDGMLEKFISTTSFIINKYYKGELSSQSILQSILLGGESTQSLQDLIINTKSFEVLYDQKVYLKWMYSFFGEPLKFKNLQKDSFGQAIQNITLSTITQKKCNGVRLKLKYMLNRIGGAKQWAED